MIQTLFHGMIQHPMTLSPPCWKQKFWYGVQVAPELFHVDELKDSKTSENWDAFQNVGHDWSSSCLGCHRMDVA